jgi:hypothetical protein
MTDGHNADSGERSFAALRAQAQRHAFPRSSVAPSGDDAHSTNSGRLAAIETADGVPDDARWGERDAEKGEGGIGRG